VRGERCEEAQKSEGCGGQGLHFAKGGAMRETDHDDLLNLLFDA
jgi:hypothetical protein